MKRLLATIFTGLFLSIASFLTWLTMTESGLYWTYKQLESQLPDGLTITQLQGKLIGPIIVKGLKYSQGDMQIQSDLVSLDWHATAFLSNTVDISRLHIQSLNVNLLNNAKASQPVTFPEIYLPWRVILHDGVIDGINIRTDDKHLSLQKLVVRGNTQLNQVNIDEFIILSEQINLNLKGIVQLTQRYQHDFDITWQFKLPTEKWAKGSGTMKGDIKTSQIKQQFTDPLPVTLDAMINDLLDHPNWYGEVLATDINPALMWSEWPGQLSAKFTSRGQFENGQLTANVDITQLTGQLRGYPVSAHGSLAWQNQGIDIDFLDVQSDSSRINIQGRLADTLNLNWTIDTRDLAVLYPQGHGQFKARGAISGSTTKPMIQASINGKGLGLPGYEIGNVNADIDFDLYTWEKIKINLESQEVTIKGYALKSLDLTADTRHVKAELASDIATAFIELNGKADSNGWHGVIDRADIQSADFSNWQLNAPVSLTIDKKTIAVEQICWLSHEARFCARMKTDNNIWQTKLEINKLPLTLFKYWLPSELEPEGLANGIAELRYSPPDQLLGQMQIEFSPGSISYPLIEGDRDRFEYLGGAIHSILDEKGLNATAEFSISHSDQIKAQLALPNVRLLALDRNNQVLQASTQLNIHDFGLIEAMIPEVQNFKGEMILNLSTTGTLAQPRLSGNALLRNGSFRIPRLGLNIDRVNLESRSDNLEKANFRLDAHSGNGNLSINGETLLDRSNGWPTTMSINGEAFEVSQIPEAQVLVSPNLRVAMQNRTIHINGDVHIPNASVQPKDVRTAVNVSSDEIIIGGEQPIEEKWSIFSKVRLTLGERVNFYGFGFDGRLDGNVLMEDEPGQLTRATGVINIPEGRYRAYGQRLDVEHGQLSYTGGPLSNPGLDLRAVRRIGEITAGLKLRGTLNQPKVELFSVPVMGQTNILAYLMLGHPIESASGEDGAMMAKAALALGLSGGDRIARTLGYHFGLDEMRVESADTGDQASLVIGRYLSPRLYISYGIGLIESVNTFSARYQITDKWQLKGESGEHQSADLLYTIER